MMKLFILFLTTSLTLFGSVVPSALLEQLDLPTNLSDKQILEIAHTQWHQNKERWEFEPYLENKREALKPIFEEMGYLRALHPRQTSYDYALIIGATMKSVQKRVALLEKFIDQGGQVKHIVFLTGMRPLLDTEKMESGAIVEREMCKVVYEQSSLPPAIPVFFTDAQMLGAKRPGTVETVADWLNTNPHPGACLIVTTQPFVPFHEALLKKILPAEFKRDLTAEAAAESWTVALLLDTLARRLDFIRESVYTQTD